MALRIGGELARFHEPWCVIDASPFVGATLTVNFREPIGRVTASYLDADDVWRIEARIDDRECAAMLRAVDDGVLERLTLTGDPGAGTITVCERPPSAPALYLVGDDGAAAAAAAARARARRDFRARPPPATPPSSADRAATRQSRPLRSAP